MMVTQIRSSGAISTSRGAKPPAPRRSGRRSAPPPRHRRSCRLAQPHRRPAASARRRLGRPPARQDGSASPGASSASTCRIPAASPPPPTGSTITSGGGQLVEDLGRDARLALDHVCVVERRQEPRARLGGKRLRRLQRVVDIVAQQPDLDPSPPKGVGLVDLLLRRRHRHEDVPARRNAGRQRLRPAHGCRRWRRRSAWPCPRHRLPHRRQRAADLVGPDRRQILALQPDLGAVRSDR